jgi:hypothetical protein
MSNELLTTEQAAEQLHVKVDTLAVWRCHKRYPLRYVKIGSKVFYRRSEIERFIESGTKPTLPLAGPFFCHQHDSFPIQFSLYISEGQDRRKYSPS